MDRQGFLEAQVELAKQEEKINLLEPQKTMNELELVETKVEIESVESQAKLATPMTETHEEITNPQEGLGKPQESIKKPQRGLDKKRKKEATRSTISQGEEEIDIANKLASLGTPTKLKACKPSIYFRRRKNTRVRFSGKLRPPSPTPIKN